MYNEKIKRQFLREIDVHGRTFALYEGEFERVSNFEELFGKDLCEFTMEEFMEAVNGIGGVSTHSLQTKASNCKRYVRWVHANGRTGLNPNPALFQISPSKIVDTTFNISKSLIKDPQHLKKILDSIDEFNETPPTFMGLNKIRRVFAWLMYSGLAQDDIVKIRDGNVDLKHRMIVYESDVYPIYYLGLQDFRDVLSMTEMEAKKSSKKTIARIPRVEGDLLLRGESYPTFKSLYNNFGILITAASKTNPDIIPLPYGKVHLSGLFYEAFLEESETGVEPRFAVQSKRELEKTKGWNEASEASKQDRIYKRSLNLRKDYKRWKAAFDL